MTTQSVTLQLPEPVFRYLQQIATATKRPLEQVVRQSVEGNLPPSVASMPADMQDELLALQALPMEQLRRTAEDQMTPADQSRHISCWTRTTQVPSGLRSRTSWLLCACLQIA